MITSTACRFFPFLGLLVRVPWPRLFVAMFRPCASLRMPTQSGGHGTRSAPVQPLADLLTYLLTYSLTYWMTDLTICAKASRARRYPCRDIALRHEAEKRLQSARQESQPQRQYAGWGLGATARLQPVLGAPARPFSYIATALVIRLNHALPGCRIHQLQMKAGCHVAIRGRWPSFCPPGPATHDRKFDTRCRSHDP